MKRLLLVIGLFIGLPSLFNATKAQNISINVNIGNQPAWGPVGYEYAEYYYFPDIDCYYGINTGLFHFRNRGRWVAAYYLPDAYRYYDLYHLYKVVLNVNDPWRYHNRHYRDYARYRGYRNQIVIRDSREHRYYKSRDNRIGWYYDKHAPKNHHKNYNGNYNKNGNWQNDYRNNDRNNDRNKYSSGRYSTPKKEYKKDNKEYNKSNARPEKQNSRTSSVRSSKSDTKSSTSSRSGRSSSSQTRSQADRSARSM